MFDDLYVLSQRYLESKYRSYHRDFSNDVLFLKNRLSILIGQRGIGKTTTIVQYLLKKARGNIKSKQILYLPADHFLLGQTSLYQIAENFVNIGGKVIAYDEIHKYNNWSKELKSIYDTFPDLHIIASGSSALEVHKGSHDLSRRAIVYEISGLSFREYLEICSSLKLDQYNLETILKNHKEIAQNIAEKFKCHGILEMFSDYLQFGYYPYFLEQKDKVLFFITLEQNFHTIIESDLGVIYPELNGRSLKKIKQLLSYIASSVPFTPQWKKIKEIVEVADERTLKTYFKYLEDAKLIRTVMGSTQKIRKLEMPEKVYLDNPNQIYAISSSQQNIGTIREIFFLTMLANSHRVTIPKQGDFLVGEKMVFEIGGSNKSFKQIKDYPSAYLALDNMIAGWGNKIPLWLFGFLY